MAWPLPPSLILSLSPDCSTNDKQEIAPLLTNTALQPRGNPLEFLPRGNPLEFLPQLLSGISFFGSPTVFQGIDLFIGWQSKEVWGHRTDLWPGDHSLPPFALSASKRMKLYLIYFPIAPFLEQSRIKYAPCLVFLEIIKIGTPRSTGS